MATRKQTPLRYQNRAFLMALGTHCRKLRTRKGFSIDRMSKEGDQLGSGAIQRLETGTADVHVSLLYRYAEVLEIPVKDLLNFDFQFNESETRILPFVEGGKPPRNSVPYYPIEIAAGIFKNDSYDIQPQGWVSVDRKGSLKDFFAATISGRSMEPTIPSGSLCLFKKYAGGTRNGQIMLIQAKGLVDPESGGRFVIKRYQRITPVSETGSRQNVTVHLLSDNPSYTPIVLKNLKEGDILTPAVFIEVLQ